MSLIFLGLQIIQTSEGIFINQSKYIKELLKKYEMENLKSITYFSFLGVIFFIWYFFNKSLMYLDWLIKIPSGSWIICSPRKNLSSPIRLISNSLVINSENFLHNEDFVEPKIISSTYICTKRISLLSYLVNKVGSTLPLVYSKLWS